MVRNKWRHPHNYSKLNWRNNMAESIKSDETGVKRLYVLSAVLRNQKFNLCRYRFKDFNNRFQRSRKVKQSPHFYELKHNLWQSTLLLLSW